MNYLYNFIGCQYTKNKYDFKFLKIIFYFNESKEKFLKNELDNDSNYIFMFDFSVQEKIFEILLNFKKYIIK